MALPWRVEPKWPVPTRNLQPRAGYHIPRPREVKASCYSSRFCKSARGSATHATLQPRPPPPLPLPAAAVVQHPRMNCSVQLAGGMSGGFGTSCIGTCRTTRCLRVGELIACTNSSCSKPGAGYFSWRRIFLFTGSVPLSSPTFNHANRDTTQTEQRNKLKPHSR